MGNYIYSEQKRDEFNSRWSRCNRQKVYYVASSMDTGDTRLRNDSSSRGRRRSHSRLFGPSDGTHKNESHPLSPLLSRVISKERRVISLLNDVESWTPVTTGRDPLKT